MVVGSLSRLLFIRLNAVRTLQTVLFKQALKDFHTEILNTIKPGDYGKQINVQAPRGTGKTTLVNRPNPSLEDLLQAIRSRHG